MLLSRKIINENCFFCRCKQHLLLFLSGNHPNNSVSIRLLDNLGEPLLPQNGCNILFLPFSNFIHQPARFSQSRAPVCRNTAVKIQPEVTFEPETALYGGADGLNFYRSISGSNVTSGCNCCISISVRYGGLQVMTSYPVYKFGKVASNTSPCTGCICGAYCCKFFCR